jgi:Viral A-type inclusion protein repeat
MAKALLGHLGGTDPRMVAEMRRLQQRVRDLENQLDRVKAENDTLAAAVRTESFDPDLFATVAEREPALT